MYTVCHCNIVILYRSLILSVGHVITAARCYFSQQHCCCVVTIIASLGRTLGLINQVNEIIALTSRKMKEEEPFEKIMLSLIR